MEKFVNYVRSGKGIGLLFMLAASVIVTIVMLLVAKSFYGEMRPQVLMVANDFLPITVKGGQIVEPADTYKRVNFRLGNTGKKSDYFTIILNTREEAASLPKGEQGLFIYKDMIYAATPGQIRSFELRDGLWDKASFENLLDSVVGAMSGVVGAVLIGRLFIVCLFKTFIAAVLGFFAAKVLNRAEQFDLPMLMRFCAIGVSAFEILRWGSILIGMNPASFHVFLAVLLLEIFYILREKPNAK